MRTINWGRLVLGGIVAGVVWTALASLINMLPEHGVAVIAVPGGRWERPSGATVGFLITLDVLMGFWAEWLYVSIRPRYGAGPRTAAITGISWWILSTLIELTWGSFGNVPPSFILPNIVFLLPAFVIAAFAGAWCYRE
jgi:hypothetical protein